jgi:hypothetical protein
MKGITSEFSAPFFTGTIAVAGAFAGKVVSIADHWYLLDLESDRFRYVSLPVLRPQADTSTEVGEQSHSREGLWRRQVSTWENGAGQDWRDRDGGNPRRFRSSRGINPWDVWELSLLPVSSEVTTNASGWNSLSVGEFTGGQRLVAGGGAGKCITVKPDLTVSTVTGLAGTCRVASNGSAAYVSDDTDIWRIDAAGTGKTSFNANVNAASALGFVKNRLIAGVGQQLWDVIDGTTAAAHYTNPWTGWVWTGFAEGQNVIYAAGYAGDRGLIFSIALKTDGTGLDAPIVALELPHGEVPYAITGYVGFVVIGTSKGVRLAQPEANGALTMGALVGGDGHTTHLHECRCLEPQDKFVWFGWDDAFSDAGGLGRIDLSRFVEPLAPAYATDLMGLQAGDCTAVTTFDNRRWFTVGTGLYRQSDTRVGEGYIETGVVTFNVADDKVAVFADVRHNAMPATSSVEVQARTLDGLYSVIGTSEQVNATRPPDLMPMNHTRAVGHELKVTLKRGSDATGPVLTGVSMAVQSAPERSFNIFVPLLIHTVESLDDSDFPLDVPGEVAYLRQLCVSQQLVRYQSGSITHLVFLEDYEWIPHHATVDGESFDGTMVVKLKSAELAL